MLSDDKAKVLIVDDNEDILFAAKLLLKPYSKFIQTEKSPELLPEILSNNTFDVIFLDMNYTKDITSGEEGFYWLKEIMKIDPLIVVILITAYGDIEMAVRGVKMGATDFIIKPWQNEKFLATFFSAVKLRKSNIQLMELQKKHKEISSYLNIKKWDLIGNSKAMQKVFQSIRKVAATDANVLILGENGTGKELVARALHNESNRSGEVFISVDMGAITYSLFESELFGHKKGAFTDAKENRVGRFELAEGGTLFLDEIGNLSLDLQAKLLTVLQNRKVQPIGSNEFKDINIRLICATNKSIAKLKDNNHFRQDLLYRINTVEIHLPPLREREDDINLLAEYFLEFYKTKYQKKDLKFDKSTIRKFMNYDWPGNVRELQHAIERAIILSEGDLLLPSDFFFCSTSENSNIENHFENEQNCNLEEIEKKIIKKVLIKFEGNVSKASKELGLTRTSLYRRIEKYGL